jgi:hypothetical protein
VFNTVYIVVNILFVLLHFPIFLILKEDKQLSTVEMDEAKSKDQHEVGQNEDDMQHTNIAAPGSGNGKFVMQAFFSFISVMYLSEIQFTSFYHLSLLLLCCTFNKQIERRNCEDDATEPNLSKDNGKGVLQLQYCFYISAILFTLCL